MLHLHYPCGVLVVGLGKHVQLLAAKFLEQGRSGEANRGTLPLLLGNAPLAATLHEPAPDSVDVMARFL